MGKFLILHLSEAKGEVRILHLSEAKGEVARQLVDEPEGDGEAVRDLIDGFGNPLRLAAYPAAIHLPRPTGRWRMPEGTVTAS